MFLLLYYFYQVKRTLIHTISVPFLSECCSRINVFAIKFVKLFKLKMTTYFTAPTSWFLFRSNELWGEIGHICQEDRNDTFWFMWKITSLISLFLSLSWEAVISAFQEKLFRKRHDGVSPSAVQIILEVYCPLLVGLSNNKASLTRYCGQDQI